MSYITYVKCQKCGYAFAYAREGREPYCAKCHEGMYP